MDGTLGRWLGSRGKLSWRDWSGLCEAIGEQGYSRTVGPFAEQLAVRPKILNRIGIDTVTHLASS
jgi:hypothetical protein